MSEEKTFRRETGAAIMATDPPSGNNSNIVLQLFMEILLILSRVKALSEQHPREVTEVFMANPLMARIFLRAELLLRRYLPLETDAILGDHTDDILDDHTDDILDDILDDQAEATYSPQPPQPHLCPAPLLHFPPQVQPSNAPPAEPVFDGGNDPGEPSSPPEEEQPPPSSQTPPNSTRGDKK